MDLRQVQEELMAGMLVTGMGLPKDSFSGAKYLTLILSNSLEH